MRSFPEFTTNGETGGKRFVAQRSPDGLYMRGGFYGPNAQEFGGTFSVSQGGGATAIELGGVIAGKTR